MAGVVAVGLLPAAGARADIGPSSDPLWFTQVGSTMFLVADDGVHGRELWKTDGTRAGTLMVKDINPDAGSNPGDLVAVGSTLFFSANDGTHGEELWKSDGTHAGTVMVKDINVGSGSSAPRSLTAVGSTLFFLPSEGPDAHYQQLWKSDGTLAGTLLIQDIGRGSSTSYLDELTNVDGTLFFLSLAQYQGTELFTSDGTVDGAQMIKDFGEVFVGNLTNIQGTLFFGADDAADSHGNELWKSDGTAAGTFMVKDINPGPESSLPFNMLAFGSGLLFRANDGVHGGELWKSDGTAAGTFMVKDINPGVRKDGKPRKSEPSQLVRVGARVLFVAHKLGYGFELWRTDGTAPGTWMVKDIRKDNGLKGSEIKYMTRLQGVGVVFQANDGVHGGELWKSNGWPRGTALVEDILPGAATSYPKFIAAFGTQAVFDAYDEVHGDEPWVTEGTAAATHLLKDINQ